MKKNNLIKVLFLLFMALNFTSCYYDKEEKLYPNKFIVITDTSNVSYVSQVKPIVDSKCATSGCHSVAGAPFSGGVKLTTYAEVFAKKDRVKVRAIDQKDMPSAAPLSTNDISILQRWLDQGAQNN